MKFYMSTLLRSVGKYYNHYMSVPWTTTTIFSVDRNYVNFQGNLFYEKDFELFVRKVLGK